MQPANDQAKKMALLCAGAFVGLNVVFYVLSASYFEGHRATLDAAGSALTVSDAQVRQARIAFAVFAAITGACGFVAWLRPRLAGHVLPAVFGALYIAPLVLGLVVSSGVRAWAASVPSVLPVFLVVSGALMLALSWHSYYRRVRPAWAFLVAMCAVFAVFELFAGMKVARQLDVSLWLLLVLPGLKVVAAAALVSLNREYIDADGKLAPA
jgi:hypothetical protein